MNIELGIIIFIYKDDIVDHRSEADVYERVDRRKNNVYK